jgi:hypothetical protein
MGHPNTLTAAHSMAAVPSTDVTHRKPFELLGELPSSLAVPKNSCRFHSEVL